MLLTPVHSCKHRVFYTSKHSYVLYKMCSRTLYIRYWPIPPTNKNKKVTKNLLWKLLGKTTLFLRWKKISFTDRTYNVSARWHFSSSTWLYSARFLFRTTNGLINISQFYECLLCPWNWIELKISNNNENRMYEYYHFDEHWINSTNRRGKSFIGS